MKIYFGTQIHHKKIALDLKDLAAESRLIQKSDALGAKWSSANYPSGYTSYGSLDKLHKMSSTFEHLEKKINRHVDSFLQDLDYQASTKSNLKMTHCWLNMMPEGAFHTSHLHPQSVISGTYYIETPTGASAIKFEDPRLGLFMNAPEIKPAAKAHNQRFVSLKIKAGDVVLFESWLRHEVPTNKSKTPRVSVSFNYGWV